MKQNFIISILFHYNSAILESGHCFKYNWFVKTTTSVTWTYLKNTYLCQCSHSNGVDQLVEKEDHLFPVANKWTKLESSSCKIFCKERNTTLDMKTWVTNNSVINCKNETVLTRIQKILSFTCQRTWQKMFLRKHQTANQHVGIHNIWCQDAHKLLKLQINKVKINDGLKTIKVTK